MLIGQLHDPTHSVRQSRYLSAGDPDGARAAASGSGMPPASLVKSMDLVLGALDPSQWRDEARPREPSRVLGAAHVRGAMPRCADLCHLASYELTAVGRGTGAPGSGGVFSCSWSS